MAFGSIYVLIDPRTEEIRYVGWTTKTLKVRLQRHKSAKSPSHRAHWFACLAQFSLHPRIALVQVVPVEHWEEAERYWIAYFRSLGCPLTNAADGGHGSLRHEVSAEARVKIGSYHRGKTISSEHRAKVGAAAAQRWEHWRATGMTMSPESRAKMSAAKTGRKMPASFGATISQKLRGKPKTPEHRERIRQALAGKAKSPAHRAKTLKQYMEP